MSKSTPTPGYELGTDQRQAWMQKYYFAPRGLGFVEPGIVPLDAADLAAYNVAKSSYQTRPDVFNLAWVAERVGIAPDEVAQRIRRMYDERLIMYVMNPAVSVYGWGLYYWFVKLHHDASDEARQKLHDWYQDKDDICTGFACKGDFDFFNGDHMRVLDNLLADVIEPWRSNPEIDWVHLAPIRRDVRESHVNMWDAPDDGYAECIWGEGQLEKLAAHTDKVDLVDLKIVEALNTKRPMADFYDFDVLSEISGLDSKQMHDGIVDVVENKRIILPLFYLNWVKLGLTNHMFVIKVFQNTPSCRKAEIVDELSRIPEFNIVLEFTDSFHDIAVAAWNEISDIDALRATLDGYAEIEEVLQADMTWQFRRWVARLDDQNGFWEECVFTDDFLQDRTKSGAPRCVLTQPRDEKTEA